MTPCILVGGAEECAILILRTEETSVNINWITQLTSPKIIIVIGTSGYELQISIPIPFVTEFPVEAPISQIFWYPQYFQAECRGSRIITSTFSFLCVPSNTRTISKAVRLYETGFTGAVAYQNTSSQPRQHPVLRINELFTLEENWPRCCCYKSRSSWRTEDLEDEL